MAFSEWNDDYSTKMVWHEGDMKEGISGIQWYSFTDNKVNQSNQLAKSQESRLIPIFSILKIK